MAGRSLWAAGIVGGLFFLGGPWARAQGVLYSLHGDAVSDEFGLSVSGAGDVDGDGFDDFIAGARGADNNGSSSGSARVYSGKTGAILFTFNGDAVSDFLGWSVSGAGDVNGDGFPDLIAGAPHDDNNGSSSGNTRVYSGQTGVILFTFNGDAAGDTLGSSVRGAGDVDGDGFNDLIAGAPANDNNGLNSGLARVYSGQTGAILFTFSGDAANDRLGGSVSGAGDVDGDGFDDLIAGATEDDNNGSSSGSAQVYSGQTGATLFTFNGDSVNYRLGNSVSGAGDADGDGFDDLIVGAENSSSNGSLSGSARVYSGQTGTILFTVNGDSAGALLGSSVGGAGDTNGDGIPDLIVGARNDNGTGGVQVLSTICGPIQSFGAGCPGSSGFLPTLSVSGCATPGGTLTLTIDHGLGGATALLLVGAGPASVPLPGGCTLLVQPFVVTTALPLGGFPFPGLGTLTLGLRLPIPAATGVPVALQTIVLDAGAPNLRFATTAGVLLAVQ